jgi:antitoxin component YwqK of YwqJK toxin-antitoxin module
MTTAVKSKLMPILNKVKVWFSKSFIKNKLLVNIRNFFMKLFDIKPKDEDDYYSFLGFKISRKLALALVVIISVFCISFLWTNKSEGASDKTNAYKTYKYNSLVLKFKTDKVAIKAKSGYTAYVGDVENGIVKGTGVLYNSSGNVVYEGEFDENKYNGEGKLYYPNTHIEYEGHFKDNLYDGEGKIYRENGTLMYEGNFVGGEMEGTGELYSSTGELIYSGNFQDGVIIYQELLNKQTTEVASMYTGKKTVYTSDDVYCVYMEDIDALYYGDDQSNTLDETFKVSGVYVFKNMLKIDGEDYALINDIAAVMDTTVYEGNTVLSDSDEIALNRACEVLGSDVLYGKSTCKEEAVFDDVFEVSSFDRQYGVYIYVYEKDGILYTFFCKDRDGEFDFYLMES